MRSRSNNRRKSRRQSDPLFSNPKLVCKGAIKGAFTGSAIGVRFGIHGVVIGAIVGGCAGYLVEELND
ncbi:MAG: hypothetical protein OCD00_06590 [Colwellia sp.]